jgi:hypothetical protein
MALSNICMIERDTTLEVLTTRHPLKSYLGLGTNST